MSERSKRTRILSFPEMITLENAHLDDFYEVKTDRGRDLYLDYQELCLASPAELVEKNGIVYEYGSGEMRPRRLRFTGVRWMKAAGLYEHLTVVPQDHPSRSLRGALYCSPPDEEGFFLLFNGSAEPASLTCAAAAVVREERSGQARSISFCRDWTTPPALMPGLVPYRTSLYQRFGGDPVTLQLGRRRYRQRLFVGSVNMHLPHRPQVDAVLNVGEEPSGWVQDGVVHALDRWVEHGEGSKGMNAAAITQEAQWVIERLQVGQRVLVHCVAGFNRSVTICCAVLMLLENLSAEAALARIRQTHPWARPDSHHWLVLQWMRVKREGETQNLLK